MKALVSAALAAGIVLSSSACMTFVAGKRISSTGRVIVGHNEDDRPPLVVRHGMLPSRDWPKGSCLPATPGCCANVPQAPHTLACYWGEVKFPYGDGNADTFLNERGVIVVSDSGGKSTERMDDPTLLTEGGVKFNLRRAVGERATSARDGVRIIGELVEKYGYAPSARIYTVADADEAWLVQVVHGRNYVAVRCPDDEVTIMPNLYTVYELDAFPASDVIASKDLVENARRKGFWDGKGKFNFAKAYQGSYDYGPERAFEHPNNTGRFRQAIRLLTGEEWPEGKPFPFSVKPRCKTFSVADMKALLSAHNPPSKAGAHVLESWSICSSTTIESSVCEFAPSPRDTVLHVAVGRGCEKPYVRLRPFSESLPKSIDDSATAVRRLETHVFPAAAFAAPYRFVTFNVWGDYFGNPPNERDVRQVEMLKGLRPDFIALQEMTKSFWSSRLITDLAGDFEAVGRKAGKDGDDSFTPILFRKERFELLGKGSAVFNPKLDKSKGVVWVAVRDVRTGERIVAFSTHFWWRTDGEGDDFIRAENARRLHAELSAAASKHSAAVVGGGDLNARPASSAIAELVRLGWRSAQDTAPGKDTRPSWHGNPVRGPDGVYHGLPLAKAERTMRLDYLFYDPACVQAYEFRVATGSHAEDLSDHYPLVFDFLVHEKREWSDPPKTIALAPREPAKGTRRIVRHWSDSVGFVRGTSEEALWRIASGELAGSSAKAVEIELDAEDDRNPIAAICGVRAVVDALGEAVPNAVLLLRPFVRYPRSEVVNREIRLLADGKRVVWCGDDEAPAKSKLPRTCTPKARTDTSGSRGKWWWLNRLEEKQNEIAAGKGEFDVVMLGDSITHFWEDFTYWSCGRDVFDGMRERYSILNLGYGGDHTENVLWRCENGDLDGYRAKVVQIMIGTNNGHDSPEDTALGVKKIIDVVTSRQPDAKILLLPIFPRGKADDANRVRVGRVNEIIKDYADGKRVVWHDFNERFLQPDGEFKPGLMIGDLLHPYHGGYELWRDAVMPKFAELIELKESTR